MPRYLGVHALVLMILKYLSFHKKNLRPNLSIYYHQFFERKYIFILQKKTKRDFFHNSLRHAILYSVVC
jgi:hypothetical protein